MKEFTDHLDMFSYILGHLRNDKYIEFGLKTRRDETTRNSRENIRKHATEEIGNGDVDWIRLDQGKV
jgi:hypothetical protein